MVQLTIHSPCNIQLAQLYLGKNLVCQVVRLTNCGHDDGGQVGWSQLKNGMLQLSSKYKADSIHIVTHPWNDLGKVDQVIPVWILYKGCTNTF